MLATHVSNTYYIYHITSHINSFAIGDVFCRPPRVSASARSNLHLARCGPVSDLVVNLRLGRIQRQLKNNINNGSLRLKLRFCRSDRSFGIHIWRLPHAPRIGDWTESMREAGEVESSLVVMRPLHIASCHVSWQSLKWLKRLLFRHSVCIRWPWVCRAVLSLHHLERSSLELGGRGVLAVHGCTNWTGIQCIHFCSTKRPIFPFTAGGLPYAPRSLTELWDWTKVQKRSTRHKKIAWHSCGLRRDDIFRWFDQQVATHLYKFQIMSLWRWGRTFDKVDYGGLLILQDHSEKHNKT